MQTVRKRRRSLEGGVEMNCPRGSNDHGDHSKEKGSTSYESGVRRRQRSMNVRRSQVIYIRWDLCLTIWLVVVSNLSIAQSLRRQPSSRHIQYHRRGQERQGTDNSTTAALPQNASSIVPIPSSPTLPPTEHPTKTWQPSIPPSTSPRPTQIPSTLPSSGPTSSLFPSYSPSTIPSMSPSRSHRPSTMPSEGPSPRPSVVPSSSPSSAPTIEIGRNNIVMVLEGIPGNELNEQQLGVWRRVTSDHVLSYYDNFEGRLQHLLPVDVKAVKTDFRYYPPSTTETELRNSSLSSSSSSKSKRQGVKILYTQVIWYAPSQNDGDSSASYNPEDFDKVETFEDPFRLDTLRYLVELTKALDNPTHIWLDHIKVGENKARAPVNNDKDFLGRGALIGLSLGLVLLAVLVVVFILYDSYKMEIRFRMAHSNGATNTNVNGSFNVDEGPAGVEGQQADANVNDNSEMAESTNVPMSKFPPPRAQSSPMSSYGSQIPPIPIREEEPENGEGDNDNANNPSRSWGSNGRPPLGPGPDRGRSPLAITLEEDLEEREDINRQTKKDSSGHQQEKTESLPPHLEGPGPLDMTLIPLDDIVDPKLSSSSAHMLSTLHE